MATRILIFSLNYYPFVGGAEVAIKEITDRIPPDDIEFHLLTLRQDSSLPKEEQIGNVRVHRIGLAVKDPSIADLRRLPLKLNVYYYQLFAARAAAKLHRRYQFDGIWAMMAHSCGIPAGAFKKRHPEFGYLLTLQEGDPPEHIERLMRPVRKWFRQGFAQADALQAISTFLARWGTRQGFRHTPVVIPNGVDTALFSRTFAAEEIARVKASLGKKDGDVFLVTTSRLVRKNAVDDVIRALPFLPSSVSFLIYGIGPDASALRALAKDLGVADRVRFMGQISHADMPLLFTACDIFVRPSRSEGMGNSFIEAMAAGLPVIATQEGGIADFLFDAKRDSDVPATGWAVDADSPEQIAAAVEDIVAHPSQVASVVKTARGMVLEKYDWSLVAAAMQRQLNGVTQHRMDRAERLVVATPLYPPELGGPATYARLLEQGLPPRGIEVALVKFGDVRKYPKLLRHLVYFWNVLRAARAGDVMLALDPVSVGLPALWAARLRRAAFCVKIVGDYAWEQGVQRFGITGTLDDFSRRTHVPLRVALLRRIQRHVASSARAVIVPSEYLKKLVITWGVHGGRIDVIYNAIVLEEGGTAPEIVQALPRPCITTAGRLVPWKRVGGIIDAVASLPDTTPASLLVIGDGPNRGMLETQAAQQLGTRANFAGALPHADTLAAVAAADVFVLNSTYEGLSHVLIEALMLGKPVIATDVGGNGELITDEENGLLIPSNDTKALTAALERMLTDTALRECLRRNAVSARERFSVERMLLHTANVIERL